MAVPHLSGLPPELILHIVSFLVTPLTILDPVTFLPLADSAGVSTNSISQLLPDLSSINALSQTNTVLQHTLDQTLYDLCSTVEPLGKLALLFAVKHELESTVDKLVATGIRLHAEYTFEDQVEFDHDQCSLLHIAAGMGLRAMVVKLLGMYGENMPAWVYKQADPTGPMTALDYAARYAHIDIVKILAPIPAPAAALRSRRQYLSLALIEAVKIGNPEISEYLISEGADVNFYDPPYPTPLYVAAGTDNLELVQLLASGALPNVHDGNDIPLFNAVFYQNLNIVQALLEGGADIHARARNVLSQCTNIELLRFCLEQGVDPNHEDLCGETALHYVCWGNSPDIYEKAAVELLLQFAPATVEKMSWFGSTPLDCAMRAGKREVVEIMEPLVQNPELKLDIAQWWNEIVVHVQENIDVTQLPGARIAIQPT
ncbi:ankyrin repeat-containing domain protein [Mycena capillaripes]|nr:ankyrin repeat-containing domain protein [Mycena capillaripes]